VIELAHRYHDGTKHHFHRFARSLGYLDWASQPSPFRAFHHARQIPLAPRPDAARETAALGHLLRYSLGLSAWKQFRGSRWSLRVNPSSGNLHPTEAYVLTGPIPGVSDSAGLYHYAADRHAIEERCAFDGEAWASIVPAETMLVVLTSIHWREAWKYGERAFRYCQHDLGHAIAAVSIAAALDAHRVVMLPEWSQRDIASLVGIDRDEDYFEAEREEPGCLLAVTSEPSERRASTLLGATLRTSKGRDALMRAVRSGRWTGRASQLSEDHVQWTFIDEIAQATDDAGHPSPPAPPAFPTAAASLARRALLLQRRSALALDGVSTVGQERFYTILAQAMPVAGAPWDAVWWDARIHLALFVHRVDDFVPGLYLLVRNARCLDRLRAACNPEFLWERVHETLPLFRLARGECRALSQRLSCDQTIAADGFFSLAMLADFDASLEEFGPSFYRHLFWESGVVGQALYLAGEAAGARGTGIGCFYDDPVHEVIGLSGHAFQSLYHFTIGMPIEDTRLTTEPGYRWEVREPLRAVQELSSRA
jgi:SagB-type dehydrogenase family enzyme